MGHHGNDVSLRDGTRRTLQGSLHSGFQRCARFDKRIHWSFRADPSVGLQQGGMETVSLFVSHAFHRRNGSFSPGGIQLVNAAP